MEDSDILDWFDENYIENKETIQKMINNVTQNSVCTPERLFHACYQLNFDREKKSVLLAEHFEAFAKMSNNGILGTKAGQKFRDYLIIDRILK